MRTDEDVERWPRVADWGVPALMAGSQLFVTWMLTDASGDPLGRDRWILVALAIFAAAAVLPWRRVAPVPVLVAAVLLSAFGVVAAGASDSAIGGPADGVALYSLAVHRGRRQAVCGCVAAFTLASAVHLVETQGAVELVANGVIDAVFYLAITAFGQLRRQHKAMRRDLRARLAGIERENRAAAEAERERLAREVHDVAGHHLSAVVVHSGAAVRLDDLDLIRRALAVAAETGREALRSLSRLVDVVGPQAGGGGLKALLPPLCHGLNRLGVPVSLTVHGRARKLPAEVTTTAYRIVQESLTNAMRYAAGAPVRVTVRYLPRAVELCVGNQAPAGGAAAPALGGGRGIGGMRERAARLGGALSAGPTPAGGWSVAARLPTTTGSEYGGWPELLDAVTVAFCATLPIVGFLAPEPLVSGRPLAGLVLVATILAVRAVPLWWRRRTPYGALAVLTVVDAVWGGAAGLWSEDFLAFFVLGCPAQMIAVYSVACYRQDGRTWPAALIAPLPCGIGLGLAIASDPESASDGTSPFAFLFGLALALLVTLPVTFAMWIWGSAAASRSRRWQINARDVTARADEAVQAERSRVSAGLSGTVLDRTAGLVRAAETGLAGSDGDVRAALGVVAEQARAALTDMRALLDALEET